MNYMNLVTLRLKLLNHRLRLLSVSDIISEGYKEMRIRYSKEADALYIRLRETGVADFDEVINDTAFIIR